MQNQLTTEEFMKAQEQRIREEKIKRQNEILNQESIKRSEDFKLIVPPLFREVEPCADKRLIDCKYSIAYGSVGTGKTFEAYAVAKRLYIDSRIISFKIATSIEIINDVFEDRNSAISRYLDYDFLAVDEFDKSNESDFNKSQIFEILNKRYEWQKKTMIICNLQSVDEITKKFPSALLDRYREVIKGFNGESRRGKVIND